MAKSKSDTPAKTETSPFPVFDPAEFLKISNRNLEVATRAATACLQGSSVFNKELFDFANARMKKDIQTVQDIMAAKDSEAAYHCQATFLTGMIRDYADEAAKMAHIAADIANASLLPLEERTEEALHYIDEHAEKQAAE